MSRAMECGKCGRIIDGDYGDLCYRCKVVVDTIRNCVPVERAYLERLERAVFVLFSKGGQFARGFLGGAEKVHGSQDEVVDIMVALGFWVETPTHPSRGTRAWKATPAAHEFAARMREKERDET